MTDDLSRESFLGVCIQSPEVASKQYGRIQVLAKLKKRKDGKWLEDKDFALAQLGASGRVFWPPFEPQPQDVSQKVLCFKVEPSIKFFENTPADKDKYQLAGLENRRWQFELFGALVLDDSSVDLRGSQRRVSNVPEGVRLYLQRGDRVVGPWTSQKLRGESECELLPPGGKTHVLEFARSNLDGESILIPRTPQWFKSFLLFEPEPNLGTPVDVASPQQKREWLGKKLRDVSPEILKALQEASPQWRHSLQAAIESTGDPVVRKVEKDRWATIEQALEELTESERHLAEIEHRPIFKSLVSKAVTEAVAKRKEEIEATARSRAENLEAEIIKKKQEKRNLEEQLDQTQRNIDTQRSRLKGAAKELLSARDRIVQEALVFQELLPRTGTRSMDEPPISTASAVPSPQLVGEAVQDHPSFATNRLLPCLRRWYPQISRAFVERFHVAVLACRWILVPGPAGVRSYCDALGGSGRLWSLPVNPSWISFETAWADGIRAAWESALARPDVIHFLLLRDLNRCLPECWAQPLLDCVAGFCDTIGMEHPTEWPSNLRLLATLANDEAVLPISKRTLRHFAGCVFDSFEEAGGAANAAIEVKGHVSASTWIRWADVSVSATCDPAQFEEFGDLGLGVARDFERIRNIFRLVSPGSDPDTVERAVRLIRVDWPMTLGESSDESA